MPFNKDGPVAVITSLAEELAPLLRMVPDIAPMPLDGPGTFHSGNLIAQAVILGHTGDGARAAREGLENLLRQRDVSHVLVLGVAGGVTDGLGAGHLVVAREVRDADGLAPEPDAQWVERAMNLPGMREAVVYTHDRVVASTADKDALGRRLLDESEARTGAATVDLETAVYARTAAEFGVPYTAIRAVSDTLQENLPLPFDEFNDADGHTRRGRVVLYALTHPWVIPLLLGLRGRVRECALRLENAAVFVLLARAGGPGMGGPGMGSGLITSAG